MTVAGGDIIPATIERFPQAKEGRARCAIEARRSGGYRPLGGAAGAHRARGGRAGRPAVRAGRAGIRGRGGDPARCSGPLGMGGPDPGGGQPVLGPASGSGGFPVGLRLRRASPPRSRFGGRPRRASSSGCGGDPGLGATRRGPWTCAGTYCSEYRRARWCVRGSPGSWSPVRSRCSLGRSWPTRSSVRSPTTSRWSGPSRRHAGVGRGERLDGGACLPGRAVGLVSAGDRRTGLRSWARLWYSDWRIRAPT